MSARSLLVRGMLVGVAAGLLAYAFASLFGESQVDAAIAFEAAHTAPGAEEPELVTRAIQSTLGLGVAVGVYGTAIGGLFALAFAFTYGRIGAVGIRTTALLVAAAGFVAVEVVPFLKYPANPPSVGRPESIGHRTTLYFLMIAVAVLAATGAAMLGRRLVRRLGTWNAVLTGLGLFVVVVTIAGLAMPGVNEVPTDFPAVVLWRFRIASLGTQLVLWTTAGLLFGALTERAARRQTHQAPQPVLVG
jgi:hypothetical protein